MPLGNDLIPSIGQAAASAFSPSTMPALPGPVIAVGGAVIFVAKVLDLVFKGEDSSA